MKTLMQILFIAFYTLTFALSQKNGEESNPYEFGFTIDGQQHRHEKKDVKGIIEGEFGFITADGVYHVTVYATDENGKFKILSTKNLQISAPLDGSPLRAKLSPEADKYRKQAGLQPLPQAAAPAKEAPPNPLAIPQYVPEQQLVVTTPKNQAPFRFTTQPTIKPACASCGFITTPEPKPGQLGNGFQFQNPVFQKQDNERQQQESLSQSGPLSGGPLSVPIPIPSSGLSGGVQEDGGEYQPPGPQNIQSIGGQQQSSQLPGNKLPQYQTANGPQNTNYHSVGGGSQESQYSTGGVQDAQRPSEALQGPPQYPVGNQNSQYSSGGSQDSQYPGAQGSQYSSGGAQDSQYPGEKSQGVQYPSGGGQGEQYPSGELAGTGGVQYSTGGESQGAQYPQYSGIGGDNNVGTNNVGYGGSVGGSAEGGTGANPLQAPEKIPEVSNFPPVSVSDGIIHVGGDHKQDIPIKDKYPGMREGLPEGIEETDITDLLYKFHYTVGFHGHYEKGLKNGAKVGGYFVNGRDGISRVVTYIADENGYRPKVKFINLGLSSAKTPKEETEKTFGLESFEFIWYPIE